MKKEYIVPAFGVLFLLLARVAYADVTISEIMYDPDGSDTNREWVEVYNDGASSVDMTSWKFVEADTNHGLTEYSGGMTLGAGEYGIIALDAATFAGEYSVSGPVFDASFSLINSGGETLSLKDVGGNVVFTVSYDPTLGANDDGNSLQKYSGSWIGADPTPGNANSDADTSGPSDDTGGGTGDGNDDDTGGDESDDSGDSSGSSSSSGGSAEEKKVQVNDEWRLTVYADSYGIVGAPSLFTTEVENLWGSRVHPGRYVWNMGDGTTYDGKEYGEVVHTYEYPGDYVIRLDYWRTGAFEKEVSVRHTFTVKATAMSIAGIIKANGNLDAEIKNTSSSEVDMTGWTIVSSLRTYAIPAGTILLPNKTLTFPSRSTHFTATEQLTLKLVAPDGGSVATSALVVAQPKATSTYSGASGRTSSSSTSARVSSSSSSSGDQGANDALSADARRSGVNLGTNMWWLFALGLVVLAVGSVVYMRREKADTEDDDDSFDVRVVGE